MFTPLGSATMQLAILAKQLMGVAPVTKKSVAALVQVKQSTFVLVLLYWQVLQPDVQALQSLFGVSAGLLVNPVEQEEHSMAAEVELYEQVSQPVPQVTQAPEVAPNWNPVLQEVQVIAPVLEERVQVLQLELEQESQLVLVVAFTPNVSSHAEHTLAPEEASREQVMQKGGQAVQDPLSSL